MRVGMRVVTRGGTRGLYESRYNNYNLLYCLAQGKIACGCVMSIARLTADIHTALGPGPSYFVFEGSSKSTDPHLSLNFRTEGALAILSVTQITTGSVPLTIRVMTNFFSLKKEEDVFLGTGHYTSGTPLR